MINRRNFTFAAAASALTAVVPGVAALAASQPDSAAGFNRPVTLIVPFAKHGPTHQMAELIAKPLAAQLGVPVKVELVTGDLGMAGTVIAAHATNDGHTLIMGQTATHAGIPVLTGNRRYDAVKDFAPVGLVGISPMVFVVPKTLPVNDLADLAAYLKVYPRSMAIAHGGEGTASHITARKLKEATGAVLLKEKVYASSAAALDDVAKGDVDIYCEQLAAALPAIKAGKVKAIGISAASRNIALPEVYTGTQQGFENLRATAFNAIFAPKGLKPAVQTKLSNALAAALDDVATQNKFRELGIHVPFVEQRGPGALAAMQKREMLEVAQLFGREVKIAA